MKDKGKPEDKLINELAELRRQVEELKRSETERRRAEEEALQRSEQRYRTYVNLTSQFAWVTDARGQIIRRCPGISQVHRTDLRGGEGRRVVQSSAPR